MITKISTKWGSDKIEVYADWSQASCQVMGDIEGGYQVADFCHSKYAALRKALGQCAMYDGMDEDESEPLIDRAMKKAVEKEREEAINAAMEQIVEDNKF